MEAANPSNFGIILTACIGGAVVVGGLLMEFFSHKDPFKNVRQCRGWLTVRSVGELLVIVGVAIEVFVAGITARQEFETRELAKKNDPLRQPASYITAIVQVEIGVTNIPQFSDAAFRNTHLELRGANIYNGEPFFNLFPLNPPRELFHKGFRNSSVSVIGYALQFDEYPRITFSEDVPTPLIPSVKEVMDSTKTIVSYMGFIPKNSEIIGGSIDLKVNGFSKKFKMPAQTSDKNYAEWSPTLEGAFILATNSVP